MLDNTYMYMYLPPEDFATVSDGSGDKVRDRESDNSLSLQLWEGLSRVGEGLDQRGRVFLKGN